MSDSAQVNCPHCNAKQVGPSDTCWLCGKSLSEKIVGLPPFAAITEREPESMSFSLATMLLIVTLASICMGLLVMNSGLGIFACIVMVPVFFRTMRVVRHREAIGAEVTSTEKITLFLGSFVLSSVLVIVGCIAAFCSFCGVCLTAVSMSGEIEALPFGLGISAVAIAGIVVTVKLFKWNRRRFRRELGEE